MLLDFRLKLSVENRLLFWLTKKKKSRLTSRRISLRTLIDWNSRALKLEV